jgi:cytochrome c553
MMSEERVASLRNRWFTTSVVVTAAIAAIGFLVGFLWLPLAQPAEGFVGVWDAICSAAGLLHTPVSSQQIVVPDYRTTGVEVTPQMFQGVDPASIGRGGTLALRCTMCHGVRGLSEANTPNLAGQYRIAIDKQLIDFKTGARMSAIMAPLVADLSDADMRDLAAYYAYLPRLTNSNAGIEPRIVASGAPLRGIAPCGACHGEVGAKASAAWLEGQPVAYLHAQLEAFAGGTRRNDIGEQMRNVARAMTPDEIDAASRYYAEHP